MRLTESRLNVAGFLGVTALVLAALVAFVKYPAAFRAGDSYRAVFSNVAGLNVGDEVRYGGVVVGAVSDIAIDERVPGRVGVRFKVRRATPVTTDTRATVAQIGLLGQPFLELRAGRPDAPRAKPGETLASEDALDLQAAIAEMSRFLQRTDTLVGALQRIADADPMAHVDRTLARVDTLMSTANRIVGGTSERADRALAGAERTFARVDTVSQSLEAMLSRADRLVAQLDTTIATTRPGLASTQTEALGALRELRTLVSDLRDAMQERGGVDELVRNLSVTSDNLARLTTRLERDPASVLQRRALPRKPAGPPVK